LRYIPHILAVLGIIFAIVFASLWSSEIQRPSRQVLDQLRVDVMGVVSGATCAYTDTSDDLLLSVLYFTPTDATFLWQMSVAGEGVVWETSERTSGAFFYSAPGRGTSFVLQPQTYSAQPNTRIRIEASAYLGTNTSVQPADFSMIEFDCTTGAVVNSTFTEEVAE